MAETKINNMVDFKCWIKTQLIQQNTSQQELARQLHVVKPRVSEAVNGKPSGKKYIAPLIRLTGGKAWFCQLTRSSWS